MPSKMLKFLRLSIDLLFVCKVPHDTKIVLSDFYPLLMIGWTVQQQIVGPIGLGLVETLLMPEV